MGTHSPYSTGTPPTRQRNLTLLLVAAAGLFGAAAARAQQNTHPVFRVTGTILLNGFRNSARVNNADVPTVVLPHDTTATLPESGLGGSIRQTRIRLLASWPEFAAGSLNGEIDADFFGGQFPSAGGRTHPVVRLRRAFGEIRWRHGSVLAGQEAPPLFELSPVSLASSGLPEFASAGNLWLWLPQIRGTVVVNPDRAVRLGVQGAVLAPSAGEPQDPFLTQPDRAERSGRPAFEGRVLARWGSGNRTGEIGVGAHFGWLATTATKVVVSKVVAISATLPIGNVLELRGEGFNGEGLAGLGGGAIGQNLSNSIKGLQTQGGWAQAILHLGRGWEATGGAGIDDPSDAQVPGGGRLRNSSTAFSLSWTLAPLTVGAEFRRLTTTYAPPVGRRSDNHLNLAVAFDF